MTQHLTNDGLTKWRPTMDGPWASTNLFKSTYNISLRSSLFVPSDSVQDQLPVKVHTQLINYRDSFKLAFLAALVQYQ